MRCLALLAIPLLSLATPAAAADLGPYYPDRQTYIERPEPPRIVERERIIERRYYEPAPVYREPVYVEPRAYYAPRVYRDAYYYPRPYAAYAYDWRPRHFFPRGPFWHHRHHRGW